MPLTALKIFKEKMHMCRTEAASHASTLHEGMLSEIVILLQLFCTTPFHRVYAMLPITEIGKGIVNQV